MIPLIPFPMDGFNHCLSLSQLSNYCAGPVDVAIQRSANPSIRILHHSHRDMGCVLKKGSICELLYEQLSHMATVHPILILLI